MDNDNFRWAREVFMVIAFFCVGGMILTGLGYAIVEGLGAVGRLIAGLV